VDTEVARGLGDVAGRAAQRLGDGLVVRLGEGLGGLVRPAAAVVEQLATSQLCQIARLDHVALGSDGLLGRALHLGPQLADVAGPVTEHTRLDERGVRLHRVRLAPDRGERIHDEPGNLLGARTERRHRDLGAAEAEVEVLAELTRHDELAKVLVRGADDSEIDRAPA